MIYFCLSEHLIILISNYSITSTWLVISIAIPFLLLVSGVIADTETIIISIGMLIQMLTKYGSDFFFLKVSSMPKYSVWANWDN